MIIAGLIGYPLSHSDSPALFQKIFRHENLPNAEYTLFPEKDINRLPGIIQHYKNLIGLNVTIPHKINIIPQLDKLSHEAGHIGSVNTISIGRSSEKPCLTGHNTDYFGFCKMMEQYLSIPPPGALILGSGGVSRTVQLALKSKEIPFLVVSRSPKTGDLPYERLNKSHLREYPLVINCTPLGMYPRNDTAPELPFQFLNESNTIFELVYNPPTTLLMKKAANREAAVYNGSLMLKTQAEKAWAIWKNYL